jgi:hypothetical protein
LQEKEALSVATEERLGFVLVNNSGDPWSNHTPEICKDSKAPNYDSVKISPVILKRIQKVINRFSVNGVCETTGREPLPMQSIEA